MLKNLPSANLIKNSKSLFAIALLLLGAIISSFALAKEVTDSPTSTSTASVDQKTKPTVIILLGAPGSGKGTQSVRLARELNIPHISTGDVLRDHVKKETELGKKVKDAMESGKLAPDNVISQMVFERISAPEYANGYILDGYPRTVTQAKDLETHLGDKAKVIVINLNVADEKLIERINKRANERSDRAGKADKAGQLDQADKSDKTEEVNKAENRSDDKFDRADKRSAEKAEKRSDDKPEIAIHRLKIYHAKTEPLIDYYKNKGLLITVDGEQKPREVFKSIMSAYKKQMQN